MNTKGLFVTGTDTGVGKTLGRKTVGRTLRLVLRDGVHVIEVIISAVGSKFEPRS